MGVLDYYGLNADGKRINLKTVPRKKVESQVNSLSVALTGARAGDVLVGKSKATKGAVLRIHDSDVPPQRRTLNGVRQYPDLWEKFIIRLGSIPFFSDMSIEEREIWLDINEAPNENSIGQEGARLELIQPGVSDFVNKLSADELDRLVQGNPESKDGYWSYAEIENMIPRKAGSKARRHTLILIRSFWAIAIDYEVVDEYKGTAIDVSAGKVTKGAETDTKQEIFVIGSIAKSYRKVVKGKKDKWERKVGASGTQEIGILSMKGRVNSREVDVIINKLFHVDLKRVRNAYRNFTGSAYKSLLQKIIRFRPEKVELGGGLVIDAPVALVVCLADLAMHPGAFVPDIQRYVTGLEAFTKRLAVTIYEDSSLPEDKLYELLSLMSGAMLVQRARTWMPTKDLIERWFKVGILAWQQEMAIKVDYWGESKKKPYVINPKNTVLENASAVLDELRSFATDLGLARGWARDFPDWEVQFAESVPNVMPLEHCVDQHWAPGLAHYFNPEYVYEVCDGHASGTPFKQLFGRIWDKSSGINPRRHNLDFTTFESQPDIVQIRSAQHLFLIALQDPGMSRPVTGARYNLEYTLDDAWIAGLVGAIEVKPRKQPTMLVTLSGDDPLELVVIRRPSRNMSDEPLTAEAEEAAKEIVRERLRVGLPLNKANPPDKSLESAKVVLVESDDDEPYYAIRKNNSRTLVEWDDVKHLEISLPVHPEVIPWSIEYALKNKGVGVQKNADESLEELLKQTTNDVIRRSLVYMNTYNVRIEMNRISRDGAGTYHAVVLEDVPAYQFMLRISTLYPAALIPDGPSRFRVQVPPVLWTIREKIAKSIQGKKLSVKGWNEVKFEDKKRKLWPHQQEMVDDMIENKEAGGKGNFLWVPVGLGKTAAVLSYLMYLKNNSQIPRYVIYTLPESAIKSIIQEIKYFGVPINLIIPLSDIRKRKERYQGVGIKISQVCKPEPFCINLIEHDHLRRCEEVLTKYAPDSFFIVDEVHKTLNDTKRTSVALEIAHLSRDFIVLTGTPVIDSNTYKLIGWLEQVVPYEVNTKNFWVAANSMIAKKVNTGVKVLTEEIVAPMSNSEEAEYYNLVPPALGGKNVKPSYGDWKEPTDICYEAANQEMINQTNNILAEGRGVMLVAKDKTHQDVLYSLLLKRSKLKKKDVYKLGSGDSIFLTDESVEEGRIPDYKVVIVPIKKAEGYTLTRLSAMVTSVYPSNNATREQIAGRINRISQKRKEVLHRIVHVGVLTAILRNHNNAKNLTIALEGLAKNIEM